VTRPARRFFRSVLVLSVLLGGLAVQTGATIRYEISLAQPESHLFHVTMTIPDVRTEVTVQMPAWNALYQIRDFSSHVQEVAAFVGDAKVPIEKIDKETWVIHANGMVTLRYATYWDDPGPFGTQLNSHHAFVNPAMVLMYLPNRRAEPCSVSFAGVPDGWKMETPGSVLDLYAGKDIDGFGVLTEPNYDALADSPIEISKTTVFDLKNISPPITVVVDGDSWTEARVADELKRICRYEVHLMGGAPYPHYTFILHIGKGAEGAGGGMEHADGTAISIPSDDQLAGVAAHEFFHLWNVKRIRPASLQPIDYTKEQYTRALWFAEGVTSTYAAYTLVRTGLWSKQDFYADLGQQINMLESRPANKWHSAEQSSLDAWLEKYSWYNGPDFSVSYYTKGQILGGLLDILIRDRTNNSKSLDDVMRLMNDEFAKNGKTYRDSLDVRLTAEKIAGGSFEDFFRRYVRGTDPLPYQEIFSRAGLQLRQAVSSRTTLGFETERGTGRAMIVSSVDSNTAAWQAGLRPGDSIVLWNGGNPPRYPSFWAGHRKSGEILRLTILRDGKQIEIQFPLGEAQQAHWTITEDPRASEKARRIREGILRGETQKQLAAAAQ
jgi:predicted metalloprotease with PDZ domain